MPKKTKIDEVPLDDLDLPDFNIDFEEEPDDRSPVTKLGKAVLTGAKDTLGSSSFIKESIKKTIPDGFKETLDTVNTVGTEGRRLYDKAVKELKPAASDLARALNGLVPEESKSIKQKLAKIAGWKTDDEKQQTIAKEKLRDDSISIQLGSIFKTQTEVDARLAARSSAENKMNLGIGLLRHKESMGVFGSMARSIMSVNNYQLKITSAYQKKNLELQYRQYFALSDILEELRKGQADRQRQLSAVVKNTGLPESVKLQSIDFFKDTARNKFWGGVTDGLFSNSNKLISQLSKNIGDSVSNKITSITNAFGSALFGVDQAVMAKEMMESTGMDPKTFAAEMMGGQGVEWLASKGGEKIKNILDKNKKVGALSRKAQFGMRNLNSLASDFSKSDIGEFDNADDSPLKKAGNWLLRALKEAIPSMDPDNTLEKDSLMNLTKPHFITRQTTKTINEVIPGYLARIYRELQVIRSGNGDIQLTSYDFSSNKFADKTVADKNMFATLVSAKDRQAIASSSESIVDQVDPEKKLSPQARQALARKLVHDRFNNKTPTAKRLTDVNTYSEDYVKKYAKQISKVMTGYFGNEQDDNLAYLDKQNAFSNSYSDLGYNIKDTRGNIQNLVNLGQYQFLKEAGLINEDSSKIDLQKLMAYNLGQEYNPVDDKLMGNIAKNKASVKQTVNQNYTTQKVVSPSNTKYAKQSVDINNNILDVLTNLTGYLVSNDKKSPNSTNNKYIKEAVDIGNNILDVLINLTSYIVSEDKEAQTQQIVKNINRINKSSRISTRTVNKQTNVSIDNQPILDSLSVNSVKTETQEIRDMMMQSGETMTAMLKVNIKSYLALKKLALNNGAPGGSDRTDPSDNEMVLLKNDTAGLLKQMAWAGTKLSKRFSLKALGLLANGAGTLRNTAGTIGGFTRSLFTKAIGFGSDRLKRAEDYADVFIRGEIEPRITAAKLMAGKYYVIGEDGAKKVLTKLDDIVGDVYEEGEKLVLSRHEIKDTFIKLVQNNKTISKVAMFARKFKDGGLDVFNKLRTFIPTTFTQGLSLGKSLINNVVSFFDSPADVYVGGEELPRLTAIMMRAGGYISKMTGKQIFKPSQIDGPVTNRNNDFILTEEDIKHGLFDKYGNEIKGPWTNLKNVLFRATSAAVGTIVKTARGGFNMFTKGAGSVKDKLANALTSFGGVSSKKSISLLEQIRNVLNDRLPGKKAKFNDRDGDGERDGSWRTMVKNNAEKAKEKMFNFKNALNERMTGVKAGVAGAGTAAAAAGTGLISSTAESIANITSGLAGATTLLGKAAGIFKYLGSGVFKVAKFLGGPLLKIITAVTGIGATGAGGLLAGGARLAAGAIGAAGTVGAATAGAATVGAAATAGTVAAGVGSVVGTTALGASALLMGAKALLLNPVVLGAAAVGLAAYGVYKGYKYFTRNNATEIDLLRYTQYGFDPKNTEYVHNVVALEDLLIKNNISFNKKGVAQFNGKGVDDEEIRNIFSLDKDDTQANKKWLQWFFDRFKPVFLTHLSAMYGIDPKADLQDVNKFKDREKLKYLNAVKFENGPYDVRVSPLSDLAVLPSGASAVAKAWQDARDKIQMPDTTSIDKETGKPDENVNNREIEKDSTGKEKKRSFFESVGDKLKSFVMNYTPIGLGIKAAEGILNAVTVTGVAAAKYFGLYADKLESIRFRIYGLVELDKDKSNAIRTLEKEVFNSCKYEADGTVSWTGKPDKILLAVGAEFGITDFGGGNAVKWIVWFQNRFLPVFLSYLAAIKSVTGRASLDSQFGINDSKKYEVASRLIAAGNFWNKPESPWGDYVLNNTAKSIDAFMNELKEASAKELLKESAKGPNKPIGNQILQKPKNIPIGKENITPKPADIPNLSFDNSTDTAGHDLEEVQVSSGGVSLTKENIGFTRPKIAKGPVLTGERGDQFLALKPTADIKNLNPEVLKNFKGMAEEYGALTGKKIPVNYGFRSRQEQERLYAQNPKKAAPPGSSLHEFGLALDIDSAVADELDKLGLMKKYGFTRPVGGEPWHIEPAAIQQHIPHVKQNAELAMQLSRASVGKGGGGYGSIKSSIMGRRDAAFAKQILDAGGKIDTSDDPIDVPKTASIITNENTAGKNVPTFGRQATPTQEGSAKPSGFMNVSYQIPKNNTSIDNQLRSADSERSGGIGGPTPAVTAPSGVMTKVPQATGTGFAAVKDTLIAAAKLVGIDPFKLITLAGMESSFNPSATAMAAPGDKKTSASGLLQFLSGTWKETLNKYGAKYGFDSSTPPTDARAAAILGAHYIKDNERSLGSNNDVVNTYLGHLLGASGAKKLLSADLNISAASVLPNAAASNRPTFYEGDRPRTVSEVIAFLRNKIQNKLRSFGISVPADSMVSKPTLTAKTEQPTTVSNTPTPQIQTTKYTPPSEPISRNTQNNFQEQFGFFDKQKPINKTEMNNVDQLSKISAGITNVLNESLMVQKQMLDQLVQLNNNVVKNKPSEVTSKSEPVPPQSTNPQIQQKIPSAQPPREAPINMGRPKYT